MSFDSIGSSRLNATDFAALRKQMFQKSDTNANGSLSEDELSAAIKNAPKPPGARNVTAPDASELFQQLDANRDGKLTESEMDAGSAKKGAKPPGGSAGAPAGGPPPGGGGGKAKGAGGGSSSGKYYDKMDADKDGTVSAEERFAYSLKHPEAAKKTEARWVTIKPPNADGTGLMLNTEV